MIVSELLPMRAHVIDVRPEDERYGGMGYIPGSRCVSVDALCDPNRAIVLVCLTGRRSEAAAQELEQAGLRRVASLDGGILAWRAAGLPVCGVQDEPAQALPRVHDVEGFIAVARSCAVAAWAEYSDTEDRFDPVRHVQQLFARTPATLRGLRDAVDELGALAVSRHHPLGVVAHHIDVLKACIDELHARGRIGE